MRIAVTRSDSERTVTPLELFFDLVYVFAIGQLSHHLLAHVDVRTGTETLILSLAVIYAWYMIAWGANWLDPDRLPVRVLLLGLMFASLVMSVGIPGAFGDDAWLFVAGYLVIQLGRASFLIVALRERPLSEHFVNDLVWEAGAGALWVAGAIAEGDDRLALWGGAILVTYIGIGSLHWLPGRGRKIDIDHSEVAAGHIVERFRLFFIIALGETVILMGDAFTGAGFEAERLAALAVAFAGTVALWWCYFHRAEAMGIEAAEAAEDGGHIGLQGTWTLTLMVVALIAIAVGDELAIAHPDYEPDLGFTILAFGGPALFLLAQIIFLFEAFGEISRSRIVAIAALGLLAVATASLSLIAGIAAAAGVLVAVAIGDSRDRGTRAQA